MNPILFILIVLGVFALLGSKKCKDILLAILAVGVVGGVIMIIVITILFIFGVVH